MKFKVIHIRQLAATLAVGLMVLIATGVGVYLDEYTSKSVSASNLNGKTVVIDPGHGGFDSGASANGAVEKDINLEISKRLKEFIEGGGGAAYLTRDTDTDTADPNRSKGVTQKKSDLQMRKAAAEKYKADIFVSVHVNKFPQAEYHGAQVFYDKDSAESKMLAEAIQQAIKDVIKDENNRTAKATGDSIFVINDNSVPSVLVECGFLSNSQEAELLKQPDYQKKTAEGIYKGILKYFENSNR